MSEIARGHATDGSPCWCDPEIIQVGGKTKVKACPACGGVGLISDTLPEPHDARDIGFLRVVDELYRATRTLLEDCQEDGDNAVLVKRCNDAVDEYEARWGVTGRREPDA